MEIIETVKGYIYCFTSPSNKKYYGKTKNVKNRLNQHKNTKNTSWYFCRSIKKYGFENFNFEIVESCECDNLNELNQKLNELEKYWISKDNTNDKKYGYNLTSGGDGTSGYKHTDEAKQKIGNFNLGKNVSEETRDKIGKIHKGKKQSELTNEKHKISVTGDKNHFYGKHHSEETKKKLSESLSGDKHPQYGKKQSEITKEKKRLSLTGKPHDRMICEHCGKDIDDRNYHRWHGDKCKLKIKENY